jgi:tripartite-type tricarboxylate transporter receptor subunit TctC
MALPTRFQLVLYSRGAALRIQDLVAGQIDMAITDPIATLPQVRAGTIKAFGVTTKTRGARCDASVATRGLWADFLSYVLVALIA